MNSGKIASYITITLFTFTAIGYLINYNRSFVKKTEMILLERQIMEIGEKCNAIASLYKIRNIQERI